jgi:hypothetical protein
MTRIEFHSNCLERNRVQEGKGIRSKIAPPFNHAAFEKVQERAEGEEGARQRSRALVCRVAFSIKGVYLRSSWARILREGQSAKPESLVHANNARAPLFL